MEATVISSTEAARHLGDYLTRVKCKGEHFILTTNDEAIAELSPAKGSNRGTWSELKAAMKNVPADAAFADDLERVNEGDQLATNPWD